jgi:hypothetical protein
VILPASWNRRGRRWAGRNGGIIPNLAEFGAGPSLLQRGFVTYGRIGPSVAGVRPISGGPPPAPPIRTGLNEE